MRHTAGMSKTRENAGGVETRSPLNGVVLAEEHRFRPGNPGRPKGARDKFPRLVDHELRKRAPGDTRTRRQRIVDAMIKKLEEGDPAILREFLKRVWPAEQHVTLHGDADNPVVLQASRVVDRMDESDRAALREIAHKALQGGDGE